MYLKKNKLLKGNLDYLIFFRVEGGNNIGLGHVIRCIALAQGFEFINIKSIFITNNNSYIEETIKKNNFIVKKIGDVKDLKEDAEKTLNIIKGQRQNNNVLITDLSNNDWMKNPEDYLNYLKIVKNKIKLLVTFDGLTEDCLSKKYLLPSDLVIIPYFKAEKFNFIKDHNIKFLLGLKYFIFKKDFDVVRNNARLINKNVKNILISMGGTDPYDNTSKVVNAILKIDKRDLNIKILFGTKNPDYIKKLKEFLEKTLNNKFEIIINAGNMSNLLLWADLAILGSGLTVYEAGITNTPCIVISQYDFHNESVENFSKVGSIIPITYSETFDENNLKNKINMLLNNYKLRKKMSKKSRKILDLKGKDRIILKINKELNNVKNQNWQ